MNTTALGQGAKNALICLAFLHLAGLAIAFVISLIFGQPLRASFETSGIVLGVLIYIGFLSTWFYSKSTADSVVLDCGAHPSKKLFLFNAAIFLFIGIGGGPNAFLDKHGGFSVTGSLFCIAFALFWIISAFSRLQIRQNGIWAYGGLLKWGKIKSYQWEGKSDCILMIKSKSRIPLPFVRSALTVPIENKSAVDDLLKKHCSNSS